jgi:flagella basal body P-ring formation protein FlgA
MSMLRRCVMFFTFVALVALSAQAAYADDAAWRPHLSHADGLVRRITADWGPTPAGGWCVDWLYSRGDTSAFDVSRAEIAGSASTGVYTVAFRRAAFGPPALVLRVRIGAERSRLVSARALARGVELSDEHLLLEHSIAWGMPIAETGAVTNVIGSITRRALRAGEPIRASDVALRPIITAGDTVRANVTAEGMTLSLRGTALRTAAIGERIAVRVARGRELTGIVIAPNVVQVP